MPRERKMYNTSEKAVKPLQVAESINALRKSSWKTPKCAQNFFNVNHVMIHITRKAFEGAPYKCTVCTEINGGPATLCSKLFRYFLISPVLVLLYLIMGDFSQGRHHIHIYNCMFLGIPLQQLEVFTQKHISYYTNKEYLKNDPMP